MIFVIIMLFWFAFFCRRSDLTHFSSYRAKRKDQIKFNLQFHSNDAICRIDYKYFGATQSSPSSSSSFPSKDDDEWFCDIYVVRLFNGTQLRTNRVPFPSSIYRTKFLSSRLIDELWVDRKVRNRFRRWLTSSIEFVISPFSSISILTHRGQRRRLGCFFEIHSVRRGPSRSRLGEKKRNTFVICQVCSECRRCISFSFSSSFVK